MSTVRVHAVVQANGELRLTGLPFREGERVEAIVQSPESVTEEGADAEARREAAREAALADLLALAKRSKFRSVGPYPSRDELHERR